MRTKAYRSGPRGFEGMVPYIHWPIATKSVVMSTYIVASMILFVLTLNVRRIKAWIRRLGAVVCCSIS